MPNWVSHTVEISVSTKQKDLLKHFLSKDERVFSFEKICPVPPRLNISAGSSENISIEAYLTNCGELELTPKFLDALKTAKNVYLPYAAFMHYDSNKHKYTTKDSPLLSMEDVESYRDAGKIYLENSFLYNATTWYDFHCRNWGTKWDAANDCIVEERDDYLFYSFDTAWSTAFPALFELSKKFPDIIISTKYADEDFGSNCGFYSLKNGEIISAYVPQTTKEGQEFAADILGYDLKSDFTFIEEEGCYVWNEYVDEYLEKNKESSLEAGSSEEK